MDIKKIRENILKLDDLEYHVMQEKGTEPAFSGAYNDFFEEGIYVDKVSREVLFTSLDKFNSSCGWPSFSKPASTLVEIDDNSYGMHRTEVRSTEANSHLGHVFNDGPQELGGMRYCINSAALLFIPIDELETEGYGEYLTLFEDKRKEL
jgi:peptide-methionine (R)-S-oxide reductase